jgi:hypothetical protein
LPVHVWAASDPDWSGNVESIHCIECGGYVRNMRRVEYRARAAGPDSVAPLDRPCTCTKPTLYMPVFRASSGQPQRIADRSEESPKTRSGG